MSAQSTQPTPQLFFDTATAYQRTATIKAAIEVDLFSAIAEGKTTPAEIAAHCSIAERGARILSDYLTMMGFLNKSNGRYSLTPDSNLFLTRRSPAFLGNAIEFLISEEIMKGFWMLTEAVRKGGTALGGDGTVDAENPIWVKFARAMHPLMAPAAAGIAEMIDPSASQPLKILDIAAGHGAFGVAFLRRNPKVEVHAVDWAPVLQVARENAAAAGVADRHHSIPGSAFDVDYGTGYDLALVTNFLHHFDPPTNEALLKKIRAALKDGGRVAALEFVPNDDRVSPIGVAGFSLTMLAGTPSGDAYTFKELDAMFRNAGYAKSEIRELPPLQQLVVSSK